jgi:hypothetical protein
MDQAQILTRSGRWFRLRNFIQGERFRAARDLAKLAYYWQAELCIRRWGSP